jgi:hypothetical protein
MRHSILGRAAILLLSLHSTDCVARVLQSGTQVQLVDKCLSAAAPQIYPIIVESLLRHGITVVEKAPVRLVIEHYPCDEFDFANQGPRDLDDAPRGPMGSRISPPILRSSTIVSTISLKLSLLTKNTSTASASFTQKASVPKGRAAWTLLPAQVRAATDGLIAQDQKNQ